MLGQISRLSCTWKIFLVIWLALSFSGCIAKQDTFLQIVVCVVDDQGVEDFKILMRKIAEEENLKLIDGNEETIRFRKESEPYSSKRLIQSDSVSIGMYTSGRGYIFAANFSSGHPYQVVLGFFQGHYPSVVHRLADRVVAEVSKRWRVEVTPEGQGSFPMKGCDG